MFRQKTCPSTFRCGVWCYLSEFAVQHLELSEFPLDTPATVGHLLSFHQANTHIVRSYCLATFLCSLGKTHTHGWFYTQMFQ